MAGNYLKVTLRKLYREKLYAAINIAGLSLGVACFVILGLYLRSELTYDQYHLHHKKIYRVVNEFTASGKTQRFAVTSPVLGPMLAEEYPEIEAYVRLRRIGQKMLYHHEQSAYYWENVLFADPNVFEVFTHRIIYGDPATALKDPGTMAVSETFARTYFGDVNPLGTVITSDKGNPNKITLVFADLPANSHVRYDVLVTYNNRDIAVPDNITARRQQLFNVNNYTYLVLPEDYKVDDFKRIADDFYLRNMEVMGKSLNASWRSWLQPLADIHLHSDVPYDEPTGNRLSLYGFAAVAVFILLVACINYMNLATARSAKRAREVGMYKILGAGRWRITLGFLGEAIFFTLIALVFGVILVEVALTLSPVTTLLGKPLSLDLAGDRALQLRLPGLCLAVGLFSGSYPAFYLSAVPPMAALAAGHSGGRAGIRLREFLVLVQFAISVGVIACTLLMALQMRYVAGKQLGFDKEHRLIITLRGVDLIAKIPVMRAELEKNSRILGVSASDQNFLGQDILINAAQIETNTGVMQTTTLNHMGVAGDYLRVMGMELAQGRDFSKKLLTDVGMSYVVNETLVKQMGWDNPLGKRLQTGRVIGVVKDFHFKSLHSPMEAFALHPLQDNFDNVPPQYRVFILRHLVLNIDGRDMRRTLDYLEQTFTRFDPRHPFEFRFIDDALNNLYLSETRLLKLTGIFAGICIAILPDRPGRSCHRAAL